MSVQLKRGQSITLTSALTIAGHTGRKGPSLREIMLAKNDLRGLAVHFKIGAKRS